MSASSLRAWRRMALRMRILLIMVLVAVMPLVVVVVLLGQQNADSIGAQSLESRQELAETIEVYIRSIILSVEDRLKDLDDVVGVGSLPAVEQRALLANLLADDRTFQRLSLLDADGRPLVRLARGSVITTADPVSDAYEVAVREVLEAADTYFGPVETDPTIREPLMTIAVPVHNVRLGTIDSVVVAEVRFQPVRDRLVALAPAGERSVYVVNAAGEVIAHRDPGVVLRGATFDVPGEDGRGPGLSGEDAFIASASLRLGDQELLVVAEQPADLALETVSRSLMVTVFVGIVAFLFAVGLAVLAARRIVRPIEVLADSARRISGGEFSHQAPVTGRDEIGDLAQAFNEMSLRLSGLVRGLEERVKVRTSELEEAAANQRELIAELESRNEELLDVKQQLEELMSSKDQFLGSVSHELRTPLTAVVGLAEELRDRPDFTQEERQFFIQTIARQALDMAEIINDLLVAARDDVDAIIVLPSPLDVRAEVQAVLEMWSEATVATALPDEPTMVLADSVRVRQIIRNLVGNTIRYGGPESEIRVEVADRDVLIQVRDNGAGIPEDEWELVFDPYHTAHRREGQPASVGLGLTVSRMLARRMDGDLSYRYEDGCSVFELRLPRPSQIARPVTATT